MLHVLVYTKLMITYFAIFITLKGALGLQGVNVSEQLNDDLDSIMQEYSTDIASKLPENSFERIFWDQQLQANAVKAHGRRCHSLHDN